MKTAISVSWILLITWNLQTTTANPNNDGHANAYSERYDYHYQVEGLTVLFSSVDVEQELTTYWELGDGTVYAESSFEHTYSQLGHYQICLTVSNEAAEILSKNCKFVNLAWDGVCDLNWEPVCGCDNRTYMNECFAENYYGVYFYTQGACQEVNSELHPEYFFSIDNNGMTYNFVNASCGSYDEVLWDFGNGNYSQQRNPKHTFYDKGTYQVCLTISNSATFEQANWCEEVYPGSVIATNDEF